MADFIADFREVIRRGTGSELKQRQVLRKLDRFERELKKVGGDVNAHPQRKFVEALCQDGHGDFKELMKQLCFARLVRGDFSSWEGWQFRNEWAEASYHPSMYERRWKPGDGAKSLAILGEQGIGDEIMFSSCLGEVCDLVPEVVVECDPRLQAVLERSFPVKTRPRSDIIHRGTSIRYLTADREEEKFIPIGDLPKLFRRSREDFPRVPYLKPLPEKVTSYADLKGRTGIAWRGRTGQFRAEDLGVVNPVFLQYDGWEYETENLSGFRPPIDLHDDVEDILGICANLEKVVTTTQTIVHFAGAVGTKVEVILPPKGSSRVENAIPYRYTQPEMVWYRDVKVFPSLMAYKR